MFFSFSLANRSVSVVVIELPVAIVSLVSCEAALMFVIALQFVKKCSLLIISLKCSRWTCGTFHFLLLLYISINCNGSSGSFFTFICNFPWLSLPAPSRYFSQYFPLLVIFMFLLRSCHYNSQFLISSSMLQLNIEAYRRGGQEYNTSDSL